MSYWSPEITPGGVLPKSENPKEIVPLNVRVTDWPVASLYPELKKKLMGRMPDRAMGRAPPRSRRGTDFRVLLGKTTKSADPVKHSGSLT